MEGGSRRRSLPWLACPRRSLLFLALSMAEIPPDGLAGADGCPGSEDPSLSGFHTTHWTAVLLAGQLGSPAAEAALEGLCRTYWYPLYSYSRRVGWSVSDGEDLTQQFLTDFIRRNSFAAATPERGRFRNFLLASFKNFLTNDYHRQAAIKRGGCIDFVSMNDTTEGGPFPGGLMDLNTPERDYDRAWAMTLLAKVMQDLKADYLAADKSTTFDLLHVFLTSDCSEMSYAKIGSELGISTAAVKMAVLRLRQRYSQMLRREIARTLADPAMVEEEFAHLVKALAGRA